ncbi:MAG: PD40 domain-containing protein [Betaproteobacteria bacterium]|nr:PD40 domain-containing protein [Betaproteobacteria bacterium]
MNRIASLIVLMCALMHGAASAQYFRMPSISGDTIAFVAEGDIWRVSTNGGAAQRITTHPDAESFPALSPDGKWLAFTGRYEGASEVYVMPLAGGAPKRLTWDGGNAARVQGWTPEGEILYSTTRFSGKPGSRLYSLDTATGERSAWPLADAAEACVLGRDLMFTRRIVMSDNVKGYRGGKAQNILKFDGRNEATTLTADFRGTSRQPMCWQGRVYFLSDRDGTMNLWSMDASGKNLERHTRHAGWDIRSASLAAGRIAYQLGADLHLFDIAAKTDRKLAITLGGDFDHTRTRWVKNPWDFVTKVALSPTGDRVALTARGQVVVAPVGTGRRVEVTRNAQQRTREAVFSADGKSILAFHDASGEFELARFASNGTGSAKTLTSNAKTLRQRILPSPDGLWIVHGDKSQNLYVHNTATGEDRRVLTSDTSPVGEVEWSPDSKWLSYVHEDKNQFSRLWLMEVASGQTRVLTSDRYHHRSPAFSPDGKWLYFLSARTLQPTVTGPWGQRNMGTTFERDTKIYALALAADAKWPFQPKDELQTAELETKTETKVDPKADASAAKPAPAKQGEAKPVAVKPIVIDFDGLTARLFEVPVPAGNTTALTTDGKRLYFVSAEANNNAPTTKRALKSVAIEPLGTVPPVVETFFDDLRSYELSQDRKKVLLRRANELWVVDTGAKAPADLAKFAVNLRDFTFAVDPKDEWKQMFTDAWRMHRDFFYDKAMHGVDWAAMRAKYAPLAARAMDRAELNDAIAQMVSEVALLHSQVGTPDVRQGPDTIDVGHLGADWVKTAEGYRVERHIDGDPELIEEKSPLDQPGARVNVGETITHINGVALDRTPPGELLRNQVGKQVMLNVKAKDGKTRLVIVTPVSTQRDGQLRYLAWESERRARVESESKGRFGYVHLQAMGGDDLARWAREFYPVFNREGLVIDLRNNGGGSIDSMILEKLMRRAWAWWQPREGSRLFQNQQMAFRGHVVAIIDEDTYSDGETMAEGLRRLGIATLVGKRTAGAGVWLSDQNTLSDNGIARAAEFGQFVSGEGWIVEGTGVAPDIEVDNPPAATYKGEDAQLAAAMKVLNEKLVAKPVVQPVVPAYPKPRRAQ